MVNMNSNRKGFTLIESLFAFSVFISVIVLLVSLYTLNGKTMLRIEKEYQEYISIQSNQEQKLNLEEGVEQCLKEVLH
ncbi:prepilin-type N [Coprobacillus sp. 8_1_38FAA]|nr:prepilin-type N [Coprobacillus sp. 8_1_38FAA]